MVLSKIKKEAKPQEGDYKITNHFAWWPKEVSGFKIWLENYKKVYEWKVRNRVIVSRGMIFNFPDCGGWDLIKEQMYNQNL